MNDASRQADGKLRRRTKAGPNLMPRNFYILRDDRGRWVVSDVPTVTDLAEEIARTEGPGTSDNRGG